MNVWVYILKCADGSYYVGSARDSLERRLGQHMSGALGGYTSTRRPVTLVWSADFQSIVDAISLERQLKGWSRAKKEALIRGDFKGVRAPAARRKRKLSSSFETAAERPPQDEEVHHAPITLVVAVAANRVIGSKGVLPWRLPEDLKRFKRLTLGKPCIMGRKTWESLPVKPLPGRTNIVVTRDANFHARGAIITTSFEGAVNIAAAERPPQIMVIGGEAIFAAALPLAQRIELTEVGAEPEGDAFMPEFDPAEWHRSAHEGPLEHNGLRYSFVTLERVRS